MKQYTYNETSLTFAYPEEWTVEQDKNVLSVFDPLRGVGALQFSIYYVPNTQNISIEEELRDYVSERHSSFAINGKNNYVYTDYILTDDNRYWKYWLFLKDSMLVFSSYNCLKDDLGKDEKRIAEIMGSIFK